MNKSIIKSKTFWLQIVTVVSAFVPQVAEFLATNPVSAIAAIGAANTIMRFATKDKVSLSGD